MESYLLCTAAFAMALAGMGEVSGFVNPELDPYAPSRRRKVAIAN
jgi:hypothetical protein